MPFQNDIIAALPTVGGPDKALLRSMITQRMVYCFDLGESVEDFVAEDPDLGTVPLYIIQNSFLYAHDPDDSLTPHDGLTCLVTFDGHRYKYGDIRIFLGLLTATDVGLGNVDNTSDVSKNSAVATLLNKTINAALNTISNLTAAMFAPNVVDIDGALSANSDTRIPTQKAVKAYADNLFAASDAMIFKGVIDCSANPNYPAADRGATYKVSVAGKIGGASGVVVEIGDMAICITDATASGNQATVGANWVIVQSNLDGAVIGPASSTNNALALFDGTTGKLIKNSGVTIDTDVALTANSDDRVASQKAVRAAIAAGGGGGASGHGQCQLSYVSGTQIALTTFNGDKIQIAGSVYQIPAAGITAANSSIHIDGTSGQNLAANTVYNVYLFNDAGTLRLDFSTTARAVDSTAGNIGVAIKNGVASRTLVGKIETNASNQFQASCVISWFNRRKLRVGLTNGTDINTSANWTEVSSSTLRCRFLSWGFEHGSIRAGYQASLRHATAANIMYVGMGIDGIVSVIGSQAGAEHVSNNLCAFANSVSTTLAEGVHYLTLVGGAAGLGNTVFVGSQVPSAIEVEYWG